MLDLKQLKYFIVCAETGSISEAARLLYTTQPSVSKAIKALENDMGIVLFDRMPRGIVLTAQGREAYRYACRIVNEFPETGRNEPPEYGEISSDLIESKLLVYQSVC